ncbi:unnamed protein product [Linum trigynum]|uniref:Uncharacterized protein n=1 Tax=Linum trigynum TaxID=586398 RepID=A0AAV2FQ38_9ROSI
MTGRLTIFAHHTFQATYLDVTQVLAMITDDLMYDQNEDNLVEPQQQDQNKRSGHRAELEYGDASPHESTQPRLPQESQHCNEGWMSVLLQTQGLGA